jgi:hypothetical protein
MSDSAPLSESSAVLVEGAPRSGGEMALLLGLFGVSRAAFRGAGVRFDAEPLSRHWHFLEPATLEADLWGSLWRLHCQPPLMNLLAGLTRLAFPNREADIFGALYFLLGAALLLAFWRLLWALETPRVLRLLFAGLWAINPTAGLYENVLLYTHVCGALLTLSAWAAWRFFLTGSRRSAAALALWWTILGLTRSLFHCYFLMLLAVALLALARLAKGRRIPPGSAALLLLPALAAGAWNAKNLYLFGEFSNSTWLGMSVAKMIYVSYPRAEIMERGRGILKQVPFSHAKEYIKFFPDLEKTGSLALDKIHKESFQESNYNSLLILRACQAYRRENWPFIRDHPAPLLRGLALSWRLYFFAPGGYWALEPNRLFIETYHDRFVRLFYWCFRADLLDPFQGPDKELKTSWKPSETSHALLNISLAVVASFLAILLWCPLFAWRVRRDPDPRRRAQGALLLYLALIVLFVAVVGNALEVGENHRFRFMTEPLCWLALAHCLSATGRRFFPKEFAS